MRIKLKTEEKKMSMSKNIARLAVPPASQQR